MVTVVVSEARDSKALVLTSQIIAYMTTFLYFLLTFGEYLNIGWTDSRLPMIYFKGNEGGNGSTRSTQQSTALVVLVAQKYGYRILPGFLTGCMIFSILYTSSTALYIASRTLYGVTREISPKRGLMSWISRPGTVSPSTGVPLWALLISALAFVWLPFVHQQKDVAVQDVSECPNLPLESHSRELRS
jgi:amino acid transporter